MSIPTKLRLWLHTLVLASAPLSPALAYDNGPQTLGCDYKLGKVEGSGKCLIVGSGLNQGISWLVFELNGKRFRYTDSSPNSIEIVDKSGKAIAKKSITNSNGQCQPGGKSADIYAFADGDRVCLYWR
jgi:hypothetical protein